MTLPKAGLHLHDAGVTDASQSTRSEDKLKLVGELRIADATALWQTLRGHGSVQRGGKLDIDLSDASVVDGAIMSLLVELRASLSARGSQSEIVGGSDHLREIVHLYGGDEPAVTMPPRPREGALSRLGRAMASVFDDFRRLSVFLGGLVAAVWTAVRVPASVNWRSVPSLAASAGADGIPIVLLLNFLVGFVMAFQSAHQLKLYGANVYVADVVGISVSRELGPLMTAIIMSGRSGAAFAAELGSMRVSEEIDALRTMGFAPAPYLILPRIAALAMVAPVLTLLGDVVGVAGGMGFAGVELHGAHGYLLCQFLSAMNRRTDGWGGSLEGRARLARETLRAMRGAVPEEFVVGVRLSPEDHGNARGLDLDESIQVARWLCDDGADSIRGLRPLHSDASRSGTRSGHCALLNNAGSHADRPSHSPSFASAD